MAGTNGFLDGTVTGTCTAQSVVLAFDIPGYVALTYVGSLSVTAAKINAQLNGSGFTNLELDVEKK
jgi:hypothetical protein